MGSAVRLFELVLNLLWSAGEHIYQFGLGNFSRHGEIEGPPVRNREIQQ